MAVKFRTIRFWEDAEGGRERDRILERSSRSVDVVVRRCERDAKDEGSDMG